MKLGIDIRIEAKSATVRCTGRLVYGPEAEYFNEVMEKLTIRVDRIALDLSELKAIDSAGVGCLVRLRQTAITTGTAVEMSALSARVEGVLRVTQVLTIFEHDALSAAGVDPELLGAAAVA